MESTLAESIQPLCSSPVFPEYFSLGDTITRDKAKPGNRGARVRSHLYLGTGQAGRRPGVDIVMHPTSRLGWVCKQAGRAEA